MKTILLKEKISNLKEEGFTDVERTLNVINTKIDGDIYNQFYINYFISYERNGVDVSHLFRAKSSYDWYINDNEKILVRDENFQPLLTEEYKNMIAPEGEEETWVKPEPTEKDYMYAPAFTYVMGIFEELQAISYAVLRAYIHENDRDGKWDLTP
ncbi:MAG TPA: hypothetical protein DEQ26_05230 [Flavobacteriaceae bacterium]|nr:hypothetical protein [Flavobacteriaceae bacterium]